MRLKFIIISSFLLCISLALSIFFDKNWFVLFSIFLILTVMGYIDMFQEKQAIRRIYPLVGRLRYVFEELRPKMYQYFIESDIDGRPINRVDRSTIYQRSKKTLQTIPFGTKMIERIWLEIYE